MLWILKKLTMIEPTAEEILNENLKYGNKTSVQDWVDVNKWVFKKHVIKAMEQYARQVSKEVEKEIAEDNPYSYWPQCDVKKCDGVSCNGGTCWRKTGYWSVCSKHSQQHREGKQQPQMKQSAIDREKSRDKNGCLQK